LAITIETAASETINCHCATVDYVDPEFEPSDLLDSELERLFA